jgi:hypothetical protein
LRVGNIWIPFIENCSFESNLIFWRKVFKVDGELAWWFERHDETIFLFKNLGFPRID